jgi:hypothetical protein
MSESGRLQRAMRHQGGTTHAWYAAAKGQTEAGMNVLPNTDPRPSVTDDERYERLWDAGVSDEDVGAGREQRSQDFPQAGQPTRPH